MAPSHQITALDFERIIGEIMSLSNEGLSRLIGSGAILEEPAFSRGRSSDLAAFYAPFDWINEDADIVLLGVTPGKQQAEAALAGLRNELRSGSPIADATRVAKLSASFAGEMRTIATKLMDHFRMNDLFGLASASELFGRSSNRVHYTSVYRYPVLKKKAASWINYPGGTSKGVFENPLLQGMVRDYLIPELKMLPNAWLVPFGPTPATILAELSEQGIVDSGRILAGLNHPSGTQWNRHKCQLDLVNHDLCAANVGCRKIRARSQELRTAVSAHLGRGQVILC
ncbi:hypothetical protein EKJ_26400 [Qipengyuania flava]|uniref:Uncharacterized protein n=1 Tax=Qipengyuania flava TaxID=192812 RepID=A0A3T1CLJ4_9SPHN|nr:hypothetical protein [Qipengyuania flava]BBI21793.1 hypothetical protein EKJ_26400 [Qipengyuania flava]